MAILKLSLTEYIAHTLTMVCIIIIEVIGNTHKTSEKLEVFFELSFCENFNTQWTDKKYSNLQIND